MKRGGADDIFRASSKGDLADVKELVEAGANINVKDGNGWTALMFATDKKHLDIVKYLVEKGADINVKDKFSSSALTYAILRNSLDIVKYLVEKGADINVKNDKGVTALILAASENRIGIVKCLVEKGADMNVKDWTGTTALMSAVSQNQFDIVKYLVEKGADVNVKSRNEMTALMWASYGDRLDIVKYLVEKGADVNAKNSDGQTACDITGSYEIKDLVCPLPPPAPQDPTGECNVPAGEADPMTAEEIKNGDVMAVFANEPRYGRYWTLEGYNQMIDWNRARHNPPRNPVTKVQFDPTKTTYCTAKIVAGGSRRKTIRRKRTKKFKKTRKQ